MNGVVGQLCFYGVLLPIVGVPDGLAGLQCYGAVRVELLRILGVRALRSSFQSSLDNGITVPMKAETAFVTGLDCPPGPGTETLS